MLAHLWGRMVDGVFRQDRGPGEAAYSLRCGGDLCRPERQRRSQLVRPPFARLVNPDSIRRQGWLVVIHVGIIDEELYIVSAPAQRRRERDYLLLSTGSIEVIYDKEKPHELSFDHAW